MIRSLAPRPPSGLLRPAIGSSDPDAITLGRLLRRHPESGEIIPTGKLRYGGEQHVLVIGANGKGKGTGLLMPHLLQSHGSSIVVVDPKGELAAVTAKHRATLEDGHGRVVVINPFGVFADRPGYEDMKSVGFNPLAALKPDSPSFNADASQLAEALVTIGEGNARHWDESARALVAALIMYVVLDARDHRRVPTFAQVRAFLCGKNREARNPIEDLLDEGIGDSSKRTALGIPKIVEAVRAKYRGFSGLRNKISQFDEWTGETRSIVSSAKTHTEPFDDEPIEKDMAKNGFDFHDLKREPITVYLVLPPEEIDRHSKWLRLVLTSAMRAVMRPREEGEPKTLFILDEFYALGHLPIIASTWALVRGYGIQIMPILQDIHQLKHLYPQTWETFIGMAGAIAAFGPNDLTTAEWMSKRAGETTRVQIGHSSNTGTSSGRAGAENSSSNEGYNYSAVKTPLFSPHDLLGFPKNTMFVSVDGVKDIAVSYAVPYYDIEECVARKRANPYVRGS